MTQIPTVDTGPLISGSHPVFDRPGLALNALLSGNLAAAGRAIYDPESLAPSERRKLSDKLGLTDTPLEGVVNVTTNPLVLVGLAMTLKWPAPTAEALATFKGGTRVLPKRWAWSRFISPVSENYRNTDIPDILQGIVKERQSELKVIHEQWAGALKKFEKATGRAFPTVEEEFVVAGLMDDLGNPHHQVWAQARDWLTKAVAEGGGGRPDLAAALTSVRLPALDAAPAYLKTLATDSRAVMKSIWERNLKDPKNQEALRDILARRDGFRGKLTSQELREIAFYYPRTRELSHVEEWDAIRRYWQEHMKTATRQKIRAGIETRQAPAAAADRTGKMLPHPDALQRLGASPQVLEAVKTINKPNFYKALAGERTFTGTAATAMTAEGVPMFYTLRYSRGLNRYFDQIARARAFSLPAPGATEAYGTRLRTAINEISRQGDNGRLMARQLENTIVPQVLGVMTEKQANAALRWSATKEKALESLSFLKDKKILGKDVYGTLSKWLLDDPSSSLPGIGSSISSWMYVSTLGVPNPVPAALNLLQPITTALPLGPDYMVTGYQKAIQKFFSYAGRRLKGVPQEKAIQQSMPEFAAANLELDPTSSEAIREALESTVQRAFQVGPKAHSLTEKMKGSLLSLFSHSEMFNRLVVFETALAKGARELPGKKWASVVTGVEEQLPNAMRHPKVQRAAQEFATQMTYMTQFGGGPLQRPSGTLNWWSPFAQFTTFPSRMASLLVGPMTRHPGYMGRGLLGAGLAYGIGKEHFGADISRGLLFGGLPEPSGYGPFPTLPVVPPALQLGGAAVLSGVSGESEHIRRALPLLMPGGIGAARAVGFVPGGQPLAEVVEKKYADYKNRTEDGRVPVYNAKGALLAYKTDTQMLASAFGLGDVAGARERELAKYLLAQRGKVRAMKKEYLQALYENDAPGATRILQSYERMFPGMGGLPIKDTDIRALHLREDVARVERLLETMPPNLRPMYTDVVSTAMGAQAPQLLGLLEPLKGTDTIRMREPYRRRSATETQKRISQGLHGVKLRDRLGMRGRDRLGRERKRYQYYGTQSWYPAGTNY